MILTTVLAAVLAVFLCTLIGVELKYDPENGLLIHIKAGPFKFRLYPVKKSLKLPDKEVLREPAEKAISVSKSLLAKDERREFIGILFDVLGKFRHAVSIDMLKIHYIVAAEDPYDAAMKFGYSNAVLGALVPLMDRALDIKEKDIQTEVDFQTENSVIIIHIAAFLTVWEIIYLAGAFTLEFVNMKYRNR